MLLNRFQSLQSGQFSSPRQPADGPSSRRRRFRQFSLLPWLVLLAGSPAWAQLSQSWEMPGDRPSPLTSSKAQSATPTAPSIPAEIGLPELEITNSSDAAPVIPKAAVNTTVKATELPPPKSSLDSPPSPSLAATLCNGTAQSLSEQIVITSETVCQSGLTPPSLWWTKEQVAQELRTSGKLVSDWSAQLKTAEAPGQVRLVVNPQMWSLMDYFERYDFVSNFGLAARGFGYQTEIYNTKGTQLASYVCAVEEDSSNLASKCSMNLGASLNFNNRSNRNPGFL